MSLKPKIINLDTPLDETVYRIYIQPSSFAVDVTCLGTECYEIENFGKYVSDLPDWIQGKLAVLMMMGEDDYGHIIEGVGFRKDRHVFYVSHEANPVSRDKLEMLAFSVRHKIPLECTRPLEGVVDG